MNLAAAWPFVLSCQCGPQCIIVENEKYKDVIKFALNYGYAGHLTDEQLGHNNKELIF